jgi:large subunit ribosomal protein L17
MKKKVYGRKLSRGLNARKALFRALIRAIVMYGSIETTKAKAKSVQADIDKLVTLAKAGGLNERRRIFAYLGNDRKTTDMLIETVKNSFSSRNSGFTRIVKLPSRKGDRAELARLEWTDKVKVDEKKSSKSKAKKTKNAVKEGRKPEKQSALKKLGALRRKTSKDKSTKKQSSK